MFIKLLVALEILLFIILMFFMALVYFGVKWAEKIYDKYFL